MYISTPIMDNTQPTIMVMPTPAIPISFPLMISHGVADDNSTSIIRLDFSSIVLFSSMFTTVKIAIHIM